MTVTFLSIAIIIIVSIASYVLITRSRKKSIENVVPKPIDKELAKCNEDYFLELRLGSMIADVQKQQRRESARCDGYFVDDDWTVIPRDIDASVNAQEHTNGDKNIEKG
ncbi:hypothetical protein [Enterovibrio norvegicus]|uniref:hypothetical protein n=1 Tax=Enterovibrio norvegicus TaxID=188144 RepID=UPI00354BF156